VYVEARRGSAAIETDVRIVSASTRPLQQVVRQNRFREDLFYRLNVIKIDLPLRERLEGVPLLAAHFCARYTAAPQPPRQPAPEVIEALLRYHWPGVRGHGAGGSLPAAARCHRRAGHCRPPDHRLNRAWRSVAGGQKGFSCILPGWGKRGKDVPPEVSASAKAWYSGRSGEL
jgi:hypothetical protein